MCDFIADKITVHSAGILFFVLYDDPKLFIYLFVHLCENHQTLQQV